MPVPPAPSPRVSPRCSQSQIRAPRWCTNGEERCRHGQNRRHIEPKGPPSSHSQPRSSISSPPSDTRRPQGSPRPPWPRSVRSTSARSSPLPRSAQALPRPDAGRLPVVVPGAAGPYRPFDRLVPWVKGADVIAFWLRSIAGWLVQTTSGADVSHYTCRVTWSVEDQEFVATCLELPSISWLAPSQLAPSQLEALSGLENVIAEAVEDMQARGEPVHVPLSERSYSGWFNLRVGESLHRRLAIEAAKENLSINSGAKRASRRVTPGGAPVSPGRSASSPGATTDDPDGMRRSHPGPRWPHEQRVEGQGRGGCGPRRVPWGSPERLRAHPGHRLRGPGDPRPARAPGREPVSGLRCRDHVDLDGGSAALHRRLRRRGPAVREAASPSG